MRTKLSKNFLMSTNSLMKLEPGFKFLSLRGTRSTIKFTIITLFWLKCKTQWLKMWCNSNWNRLTLALEFTSIRFWKMKIDNLIFQIILLLLQKIKRRLKIKLIRKLLWTSSLRKTLKISKKLKMKQISFYKLLEKNWKLQSNQRLKR